ncbi:Z1 domain-containing protein [Xanthomonas oryzae]|uniref:Z1 domain-containing protein n=1 Tax=Xanthomonas oryzae TaxID=347 RepID=UPI000CA0628F
MPRWPSDWLGLSPEASHTARVAGSHRTNEFEFSNTVELARTHDGLAKFDFNRLLSRIEFLSAGIYVKLVNGETDEDVALHAPYNLFVGGNKLGRGVTIKNLLVSYYGRHPKTPQADTVLQHARMYGYRRKDIGLLRLWLPPELHAVFSAINEMERSLRKLIADSPDEEFRGVYLKNTLQATID